MTGSNISRGRIRQLAQGCPREAIDDLRWVVGHLSRSEVARTLSHPALTVHERRAVLEQTFGNLHEWVSQTAAELAGRRELPMLAAASRWLERQPDTVPHAIVHTARTLEPGERAKLEKLLRQTGGQEVSIQEQLDPGLIAGFTLRFGFRYWNFSLRGRLEQLRKQLAAEDEGKRDEAVER